MSDKFGEKRIEHGMIQEKTSKDITDNRKYNYINNDIKIDFELSHTMQDLVDKAEKADILEDYGLYMNLADAIDSQAKKEVNRHLITETEWRKLVRRYELWFDNGSNTIILCSANLKMIRYLRIPFLFVNNKKHSYNYAKIAMFFFIIL